jgi:hypothetical protein
VEFKECLPIWELKICAVHTIDDYKFRVNFEIIVFHVGLDVYQNLEVVIVKKDDATIPYKILVCKSENGGNIVVNFCIPLGNS